MRLSARCLVRRPSYLELPLTSTREGAPAWGIEKDTRQCICDQEDLGSVSRSWVTFIQEPPGDIYNRTHVEVSADRGYGFILIVYT
jgi:hypothetical protein